MKGKRRSIDELQSEPGEPLPPGDEHETTWLFTCCECGKRWADPPGPVTGCSCGSEQVVGHKFDQEQYWTLQLSE